MRWTGLVVALSALSACGGTTETGTGTPGGGGGSSGAAGGRAGLGGRSSGAGGTVSVSPGKVSIAFTVSGPETYCMTSQCDGPSVAIKDARGNPLTLQANCTDVDCASCSTSGCPNIFCQPMGIAVTGAKRDWDGAYYASSACGGGTACLMPVYASPGRYTATFCATPGILSGPRTDPPGGGIEGCVATGPQKCASVDFDFPSSGTIAGTIGP